MRGLDHITVPFNEQREWGLDRWRRFHTERLISDTVEFIDPDGSEAISGRQFMRKQNRITKFALLETDLQRTHGRRKVGAVSRAQGDVTQVCLHVFLSGAKSARLATY